MEQIGFWMVIIGLVCIAIATYVMSNYDKWKQTELEAKLSDFSLKIQSLENSRNANAVTVAKLQETLAKIEKDHWKMKEKIANKTHVHLYKPLQFKTEASKVGIYD